MSIDTKEFWQDAVKAEIQAANFYNDLSSKVQNPKATKRLQKLAADEADHRMELLKQYGAHFNQSYRIPKDQEPEPLFDFAAKAITEQATALEVISVAIGAENKAIERYSTAKEQADNPVDEKLMEKLVKFEQKHKKKLQKEYQRLEKKFDWF
jgi:rubrerythrin